MKRRMNILVFITVLFFLCSITTTMADAKDIRYVVVFQNEQVPENAAQLIEAAGGRLVKTLPSIGVVIAVSSSPDFASSLSNTPGIDSVSVERSLKVQGAGKPKPFECAPDSENDSCFGAQWNIRRVHADKAWGITTGSHKTVVAVIDTGIATNHPDLKQNVLHEFCCPSSEDECIPPSSEDPSCNPYPEDPCWGYHGTSVASIIAASFGGGGLKGVGPNLGLASYNVWEAPGQNGQNCNYSASDSSIWAAMLHAARSRFKVINISLGGLLCCDSKAEGIIHCSKDDYATITAWTRVVQRVMQKGSLIVAGAGNDGINLDGPAFYIPADLPGVISVGATGIRPRPVYPQPDAFDVMAYYSNYGKTIDLVAPGGDYGPDCNFDICENYDENYLVLTASVWPSRRCAKTASCPYFYSLTGGTSYSTPHVSAVAGLILDKYPYLNQYPYLSPFIITTILKGTADDLGDPLHFGSGMVNAFRALEKARKR